MQACSRCGYPFKETDTFCTVCGVPLPKKDTAAADTAPVDTPNKPVWETAKPANPNDIPNDLYDEESAGSSSRQHEDAPNVVYKSLDEDLFKRARHETDVLRNEIQSNRTKILAVILILAILILAAVLFRSCTLQLFDSATAGTDNTLSSLYGPIG